MKSYFQFLRSSGGTRNANDIMELAALMEGNPQAAILVNSSTRRILYGNSLAISVSKYPLSDFTGLKINDLFTNWVFNNPQNAVVGGTGMEETEALLLCKDGSSISVNLVVTRLPPDGDLSLLVLETPTIKGKSDLSALDSYWESLQVLVGSPQETNFQKAVERALNSTQLISQSDSLAIYIANDQGPSLDLFADIGDTDWLPDTLPSEDLSILRDPHLWKAGNRINSNLHRTARTNKYSYLSTAPLGQPRAMIGLVVIASKQTVPPNYINQITRILASTLTSIIQDQTNRSENDQTIKNLQKTITVSRKIEQTIREGLIILDSNNFVVHINKSAEVMLGYSNKEAYSQPADLILIGSKELVHMLNSAKKGIPSGNPDTTQLYRRSGEAFTANVRTYPIGDSGNVDAILVLIQDLSELEEIEEHAQKLEQKATLGDVTAIFAHEVRNPINNISTGLQLISLNLPDNDPNREVAERLLRDCVRLEDLMKSVLSFSKPAEYTMVNVDIDHLLRKLIDHFSPRMERFNISSNIQTDPDCPPVKGNYRALEQVFTNLILNAIQAMRENGGQLSIKIQTYDLPGGKDYLLVNIADTGPGIPNEIQERIFQPFFTSKEGGTGLGLAIAKRIVTAHKGTINVNSFPGGSIFIVQLPVAEL